MVINFPRTIFLAAALLGLSGAAATVQAGGLLRHLFDHVGAHIAREVQDAVNHGSHSGTASDVLSIGELESCVRQAAALDERSARIEARAGAPSSMDELDALLLRRQIAAYHAKCSDKKYRPTDMAVVKTKLGLE